MKKNIFLFSFTLLLLGGLCIVPQAALAKTVYVDEDGDDSDDGSSDHPYKTLAAAAEEVNEGDADGVKFGKGTFAGSETFEQGVVIQGAGKGSTTLTGTLTFRKKVELKNLSIKTKSKNAVIIGKNSTATIENVDIREYSGIGIWVLSGGGVLTVEDSRIGGGAGKGIYAEAGTKLTVTGSSIVNNKQEGIDIRQNTRGTIKNNTIESNSESGIELIVGSSDFVISGNDIKRNGASGIAYQFYELNRKAGSLITSGNTISGNGKSGIDCNKPQKGDTPVGYWADSITLEGNTFSNNKLSDISIGCKIIEAKTQEEEMALEKQLEQEKKEKELQTAMDDPLFQEKMKQETEAAELLVAKIEGVDSNEAYQNALADLQNHKTVWVIVHGWEYETLHPLREAVENEQNQFLAYKESLGELSVYVSRTDLQDRVRIKEEELDQHRAVLESYSQDKGLRKYWSQTMSVRFSKFIYAIFF